MSGFKMYLNLFHVIYVCLCNLCLLYCIIAFLSDDDCAIVYIYIVCFLVCDSAALFPFFLFCFMAFTVVNWVWVNLRLQLSLQITKQLSSLARNIDLQACVTLIDTDRIFSRSFVGIDV